MSQKIIAISINASWNIINFRSGLIRALQGEGYKVVALAPIDDYSERLADLGVEHIPLPMVSRSVSPVRDLLLLGRYWRALRRLQPQVLLAYTVKPNIYGSLAAHILGIDVINNVSGLGTAFIRQDLLTDIVAWLYKLALSRSATVFFQNEEDRALFLAKGMVEPAQALLLPGSGVDIDRFTPAPQTGSDAEFRFLLVGRLLWFKGVGEYVEAARLIKAEVPGARFQLLGFLDPANPNGVGQDDLDRWCAEGVIEYLGQSDDVRPFIANADCVVLPSYREGLPRTLLEAGAMARPMIATDVPGCRQVVDHGVNGFLCPARSAPALAASMLEMLRLPAARRRAMGEAARARVESDYDERIAIDAYRKAIGDALGK